MDKFDPHPMPRIDDTVTSANLHERAEAVAVPNFDYLAQPIEAVTEGFIHLFQRHFGRRAAAVGQEGAAERGVGGINAAE